MSYRVRFTLPHGSTGHWAREYATREEAQRLIRERQEETGLAYVVEEVVETAAVPDASPEARIRDLEAELAQLRDAYDAAVQDLDVAMRRLAIAEDLGDSMHRAVTNAPNYLHGPWLGPINRALEQWASHKDTIAASRQGPAKASGGAGGTAHTGPEHQPGAGQGVASRLIVDLGAIEQEGPAKASEAPGDGGDSGEGEMTRPDPTVDDIIREMVREAKASDSTTERLVAMLRERHDRGLAKYGTTVDRTDLTPEQWAQHAIEEMLDGAAYLIRLRDTMAEARAKDAKP